MSNYQRVEEQDFVAEAIVLDPSAKRRPLFPIFFKTLIFSLLVVFPFFMGGKEPSIRLLAQGVIFAAIGCFAVLVSLGRQPIWLTPVSATLLKFIGAFSLLIIFQLIPWPLSILAVFSPAGEKLYQTTGVASAPISLNYFASVEALLWSLSVLGLTALTLLLPQEQLQIRLSREMKSRGAGANPLLNLARTTEAIADGLQTSVIYTGLLFSVIALLHLTTNTPALFGFFLPGGVSLGSPRAHWPFVNPNHLAVFLEVSIILLGARFFRLLELQNIKDPLRGQQSLGLRFIRNPEKYNREIIMLLQLLVISLAMVFTLSRAGLSLLLIGLMFLTWSYERGRRVVRPGGDKPRQGVFERFFGRAAALMLGRLKMPALFLLFATIVLLFLGEGGRELLAKRVEYGLTVDKGQVRWELMGLTTEIFSNFPLWGVGLGSWSAIAPKFAGPSLAAFSLDYAHNDPWQFVSETGLIGLALASIGLIYLARITRRALLALPSYPQRMELVGTSLALLVPFCHSFLDFPFHIPALAILFGLTMAIHLRLVSNALASAEAV